MPKDYTNDMKTFLKHLRGEEKAKIKAIAQSKYFLEITIKTKNNSTKFKLRCPRFLYTATVTDPSKAEKIKSSIPNTVYRVELGGKKPKRDEKQATGKKAPKKA
jgi:Ribosomal L38e protein family